MKKFLWLLALGSLSFTLNTRANDDELLLAVNTNFRPARAAGATEEQAVTPPAPPPAALPAPAAPQPAPEPVVIIAPAPVAEVPPVTDERREAATTAAQEAIVRRQADQLGARNLIGEADTLYREGDYEGAAAKYAAALQALPPAPATADDREDATVGLNRAYYRLAEAALAEKNYAKAKEHAQQALEFDPQSRSAARMLDRADRLHRFDEAQKDRPQPPPDPAQAPAFLAARDQVKELFREGKLLLNSGQLDAAETKFQQIILIDPYNDDAYTFLEELNAKRLASAHHGTLKSRNQRLWEVSRAWLPHLGGRVERPEPVAGTLIDRDPKRQAEIQRKLTEIVFPEINFRDAVITDVMTFLSNESRKLDPTATGVNIVLQLPDTGAAPVPAAPAGGFGEFGADPGGFGEFGDAPGGFGAPAPDGGGASASRRISVTLRGIPMIDALRLITTAAALKFRVEPYAVVILDKDAPDGDLLTRTYPVAPGVIADVVSGQDAGAGGGDGFDAEFRGLGAGAAAAPEDVKKFFQDAGVPFPAGSSLVYNQRSSKVIVRNTPENLEIFENILRDINETPLQVEIEAKFIDISQSDLDELGFDWKVGKYIFGDFDSEGGGPSELFPPGSGPNTGTAEDGSTKLITTDLITGGLRNSEVAKASGVDALLGLGGAASVNEVATLRGVLTNPQFEVVIRALNQKKSTDVLSAPKITTISGNAAQIRVVQEFIYPTEYEPPQVGENVVSPAIPSGFKTREIGVLLNVTPTVGPDRFTINLTVIPEVSEFLGFIDYSPPDTVSILRDAEGEIISEQRSGNTIQQPLFSTRNLTTTVVVWDGQTVVLGGLIREQIDKIDDKVPFLGDIPFVGRLFRSKVDVRSKRNLLIFVTARLVDPAGNPINKPDTVAVVTGGGAN